MPRRPRHTRAVVAFASLIAVTLGLMVSMVACGDNLGAKPDAPGVDVMTTTPDADLCAGVTCTGANYCDHGNCVPYPPCDAGGNCPAGQMCQHDKCVPNDIDADGDGVTVATDCDDSDPLINPNAAERCNAIDDNCNTTLDDGFDCVSGSVDLSCTSSCGSSGKRDCMSDCSFGACVPPAEICNGVDDDCDSTADDGFACASGAVTSCSSTCGSTGTSTCSNTCTVGACMPPAESCNGLDDDCDSTPDDGFACVQGAVSSCSTTCGSTGASTCSNTCTAGACAPPAESCNGIDDDCDSTADDGFACVQNAALGGCTTACGSAGSRSCTSSCTVGACVPPAESCNGLDDDCDAVADDGFACVQNAALGGCTTTCGSTGSHSCTSGCTVGACVPPAESCNGLDDDCDAVADDGFSCVRGAVNACTTTCGSTGASTCSNSCTVGACVPPGEACNGLDDDCDAVADDGFACVQNAALGACTTTCGSTGTHSCSASCTVGACQPPAETCNGLDDDCDAVADDGFACVQNSSLASCTTTCGSTGTQSCTASCTVGACAPPTETCNGADDDCDGVADDGDPVALCASDPDGDTCSGAGLPGADCVCFPGTFNLDPLIPKCECTAAPALNLGADCANAINIGSLSDVGQLVTVSGNIPNNREIWYRVTAIDTGDTSCDNFHFRALLQTNPASQFQFRVERGSCPSAATARDTDYEWYTDFRATVAGQLAGQCPCWTGTPVDNLSQCANDSSDYYIVVDRAVGPAPSCDSFQLEVSNGIYDAP